MQTPLDAVPNFLLPRLSHLLAHRSISGSLVLFFVMRTCLSAGPFSQPLLRSRHGSPLGDTVPSKTPGGLTVHSRAAAITGHL